MFGTYAFGAPYFADGPDLVITPIPPIPPVAPPVSSGGGPSLERRPFPHDIDGYGRLEIQKAQLRGFGTIGAVDLVGEGVLTLVSPVVESNWQVQTPDLLASGVLDMTQSIRMFGLATAKPFRKKSAKRHRD